MLCYEIIFRLLIVEIISVLMIISGALTRPYAFCPPPTHRGKRASFLVLRETVAGPIFDASSGSSYSQGARASDKAGA